MKVSLNFEFDSNEAAEAFLRQVRERAAQIAEPDQAEEAPPAAAKRQRKKAAPVAPDPEPDYGAKPKDAPKIKDVQSAIERLFAKRGMQPCMDLLSRYGVKKAGEMKPEQYAKFLAEVEEVIGGKDPAAVS